MISLRHRIFSAFQEPERSVFDMREHRPLALAKAGGRKR